MNRVISIVVAIAIGIGAYMYRSSQSDKIDQKIEAMPERVMAVCEKTPGFDKFGDYIERNGEAAHQYAIDIAYTAGGRRSSPKFDAAKYATAFGDNLLARVKMDKARSSDLEAFLRQVQIDLETAARNGEFE